MISENKRKIAVFMLLCACFFPVLAQNSINILRLFDRSFEVANGRCLGGRYKGQIVKGRRNGMGFVLSKEDFLYAGDFYRNDISGVGIMILAEGIEGCPNGVVYVGNWEKGKRSGFGRCYNEAGDIVYQGMFLDDVPQGLSADAKIDKKRHFGFCDLGDNQYFVGEYYDGIANGMGIFIYSDGGLWLSHFKGGSLNGVGLYCAYDGSWQTRNVMGEEFCVVTSSDDYKMNDAIRRQNAVLSWSDVSDALAALSQSLPTTSSTSLSGNIVGSVGDDNVSASLATRESNSSSASASSGANAGWYQEQYNNWARRAEGCYSSLTNIGYSTTRKDGSKRGGTGQSMSGGNYVLMKKNLRQAQNEMQRIRRQASRDGITIRQSKWETAVVKY